MSKPHFIISDAAVKTPNALSACGRNVTRVGQITSDLDLQHVDLNSLTGCKKCQKAEAEARGKGIYLYVGLER